MYKWKPSVDMYISLMLQLLVDSSSSSTTTTTTTTTQHSKIE